MLVSKYKQINYLTLIIICILNNIRHVQIFHFDHCNYFVQHQIKEKTFLFIGVEFSSPTSSKDHSSQTSLPCQTTSTSSSSTTTSGSLAPGLAVLEEKDEVMVSRWDIETLKMEGGGADFLFGK